MEKEQRNSFRIIIFIFIRSVDGLAHKWAAINASENINVQIVERKKKRSNFGKENRISEKNFEYVICSHLSFDIISSMTLVESWKQMSFFSLIAPKIFIYRFVPIMLGINQILWFEVSVWRPIYKLFGSWIMWMAGAGVWTAAIEDKIIKINR